MRIKNVGTTRIELADLNTHPGISGTQLPPNAEIVIYDEDAERSIALAAALKSGRIVKTGDEEPLEDTHEVDVEQVDKVITWIISNDMSIQFGGGNDGINGPMSDNTYSGTHGTPVVVTLNVTDGDGTLDTFNSVATVVVTIAGGTATSKTINGGAGPVTVTFVNGAATVNIDAATLGTVLLTLGGGNTSLNRADTATITLA